MEKFIAAYIEAMYFTGEEELGDRELAPETLTRIKSDCESFQERAGKLIMDDLKLAGHDFWLTRNGHGAGFWDGDWTTSGDELTKIAKSFGEAYAYVGDDGLIYLT